MKELKSRTLSSHAALNEIWFQAIKHIDAGESPEVVNEWL
jgi:hypothetical protein